jgi:5-formyltetrahydrofolate cyclo-ligase
MAELTKQQLRQILLTKRQSLSQEQWQEMSKRLCDRLVNLTLFQQAKTILAYSSFRQEPDLSFLFNNYHNWGLPRCVNKSLIWHRWESQSSLHKGAFGILEPAPDSPIINSLDADLIFVPAVAGDERGYRLGYGGGFYDRMFATPEWQNIPTIGIIFDFAYVKELPIEIWDRPLDAICTEDQIIDTPRDESTGILE